MASANQASSTNPPKFYWQIQNTESQDELEASELLKKPPYSRADSKIPELLEKYPYSQTKEALKANGTQPMPAAQGISVQWQLMKEGAKVKFPQLHGVRYFQINMFAEGSKDPETEWISEIKDEFPGNAKAYLHGDRYTFRATIDAPCYAKSPGYYLIEIIRYTFDLELGENGTTDYVHGKVWVNVSAEDK